MFCKHLNGKCRFIMGRFVSRFVPMPFRGKALWFIRNVFYFVDYYLLGPLRRIFYFGFSFYCPLCRSYLRRFCNFVDERPDAKCCPVCGSMERHRWIWNFLKEKTDLFDCTRQKMLHIAPEKSLSRHFRKISSLDYLSGELTAGKAMEQIDITDIQYPDESFDVIYCSHVLEHVPNDRKAICEFYRVLKDGGWALIVVPIKREITFEDGSVTSSVERQRVFGHPEHVRICGEDYKDRLVAAGFSVNTIEVLDVLSEEDVKRLGLLDEPLYFCKK